jgi:hypothetical protein
MNNKSQTAKLAGPKDWPQDFSHENGNYMCRCVFCKGNLIGHKRCVVCRECTMEAERQFYLENIATQ